MTTAQQILWNVTEVDVYGGLLHASAGIGGATDWELLEFRKNPPWWERTLWFRDDKQVSNPLERPYEQRVL